VEITLNDGTVLSDHVTNVRGTVDNPMTREEVIQKCRDLAGATNPEEAESTSIRGSYGRITTSGVYENVIHVSSDAEDAEREIKLWFRPDEIIVDLYPTKEITEKEHKRKGWA
jgi:nucleoside-diphosphate kinase